MPKQSVNGVTVKTGKRSSTLLEKYSVLTPGQTAPNQFIPIFMSQRSRESSKAHVFRHVLTIVLSRPDANYEYS